MSFSRQCIFSVFGGDVTHAGETVHGKTSQIKHDGRGIYRNVPQDIAVTRYHSLAATHVSLPEELEVTSWSDSGVIMGVRHKEYTIEGVQYHPESILTEDGRLLIRNFLEMKGGTWRESNAGQISRTASPRPPTKQAPSILDKIYADRRARVAAQKLVPSQRPEDLKMLYDLAIAPPQIDFAARLRAVSTDVALMAEIKRASPSKGDIDLQASAPLQARTYALSGAAAISVLTEPHWFKGSIDDLRASRQAIEGMPNRPAILRKEFVFDEYQILEARLAGADTVLLIVKMLEQDELERLYKYSKSLGMEPLVEVNDQEEMKRALAIGSRVIGVNNRDLHSFKVELGTTSGLVGMIDPKEVTLCALSGITTRADVERYEKDGVGAILVGEALMRAGKDVGKCVRMLLGVEDESSTNLTKTVGEALIRTSKDVDKCVQMLLDADESTTNLTKTVGTVGEALMRAGKDVDKCAQMLLGADESSTNLAKTNTTNGTKNAASSSGLLVKICGTRTVEAAKVAIESGADFVGIILVPGARRAVDISTALSISNAVHTTHKPGVDPIPHSSTTTIPYDARDWFSHSNTSLLSHPTRALLVGVFRDQPLAEVIHLQRILELDIVQLHGSEPQEWARQIPCPVIKKFDPSQAPVIFTRGYHAGILLDAGTGGTGQMLDLSKVSEAIDSVGTAGVILAGGLDESNVLEVVEKVGRRSLVGVDVSSGVESDGKHDLERIRRFVHAVKGRSANGV